MLPHTAPLTYHALPLIMQTSLLAIDTSLHWFYFYLFILVALYLLTAKKRHNHKAPNPLPPPPVAAEGLSWNTRIQYFSNGRQLPAPHFAFYWKELGISERLPLHIVVIALTFEQCFDAYQEAKKQGAPDVMLADLKAARNYLTDRFILLHYTN